MTDEIDSFLVARHPGPDPDSSPPYLQRAPDPRGLACPA